MRGWWTCNLEVPEAAWTAVWQDIHMKHALNLKQSYYNLLGSLKVLVLIILGARFALPLVSTQGCLWQCHVALLQA